MTLRGKTLFITGARRGIGKAIALRAARDGANVAMAVRRTHRTRNSPAPSTARARNRACRRPRHRLRDDIRHEEQVLAAVDKTVSAFGGIDILVNNASAISLTGTLATEMKRFDLMHR